MSNCKATPYMTSSNASRAWLSPRKIIHAAFTKQIRWNSKSPGTWQASHRCRRGQCKSPGERSMTNRYLMSVAAAALIAGTGFASAQGSREAPSSGAATQHQNAPSERGSAANRDSSQSGAPADSSKSAQSKEMDRNGAKNQRAQDDMKAGAKGEKSAQDNNMKGERSKGMSSENDKAGASKDMKADSKSGNMDSKTGTNNAQTGTDTKSGATNAQTGTDSKGGATNAQTGTDNKGGATNAQTGSGTNSQTTGNAATSATAAPPPEKRGQIVSAIKSEKIQETTNVNFNVSVGATIPASVHFHPLPPRIVEIYPEWRGYEVVLVHGRYVIVRPQTREIVYIIEG